MIQQRTLRQSICAEGVGLHTGKKITMRLAPAPEDTGVVIRRTDFDPPVSIRVHPDNVSATRLSTTLSSGDVHVSTVEHLLSAVAGMGVDNLYVDLDASEVPIMDGSSGPFVFLLHSAGLVEQDQPKHYVRIRKAVEVRSEDGNKWARLSPHDGFRVGFTISFDHPVIQGTPQSLQLDLSATSYIKEVSRARTFGFQQEVEQLQERNLALGGSLDNALVLGENHILNESGLRYSDEFVKHKILDVIGDLYLLGSNLLGSFEGYCSGHELNIQLLRKLLQTKGAIEHVVFDDKKDVPITFEQGDIQPASA